MAEDKKRDDDKGGLDRAAFKHAIGMIESSGGKFLDSKYSSAAGKYHFLYSLIKNDPDMKGISKRQFINNPELQERIMDKAISGELSGYVGYESNARNLKSQFDTDLSVTEIAALTHFLGARGARNYLTDPNKYSTPGKVNATPQKYIDLFRKHSRPTVDQSIPKNTNRPFINDESARQMEQPKDAVNINTPQPRKELQGLQFKQNTKIDTSALPEFVSDDSVEPNVIPLEEQVEGGTPSGLKVLNSMVESFADGGSTGLEGSKKLIEFNTGGTHDQNPLGGIPIGVGSNGKLNTVEEGETQFGDYIFSNRYGYGGKTNEYKCGGNTNKMANGGDVDPVDPKKKAVVDESKSFVKNWFNDPVTKARYSANRGRGFSETLPEIEKGLGAVDAAEVEYDSPTSNKAAGAGYAHDKISFYKDPTPETATHEFTHAMGIDDNLSKYMKDNYGTPAKAIQDKTGKPFKESIAQEFSIDDTTSFGRQKVQNTIEHSRYMSGNGELYPRIMEMRKVLDVKPGDVIDDAHIKRLKTETDNPLFKYYSDEQIKEMLNTLASNDAKPQPQTEYRLS